MMQLLLRRNTNWRLDETPLLLQARHLLYNFVEHDVGRADASGGTVAFSD
jgi:hypothetical protein